MLFLQFISLLHQSPMFYYFNSLILCQYNKFFIIRVTGKVIIFYQNVQLFFSIKLYEKILCLFGQIICQYFHPTKNKTVPIIWNFIFIVFWLLSDRFRFRGLFSHISSQFIRKIYGCLIKTFYKIVLKISQFSSFSMHLNIDIYKSLFLNNNSIQIHIKLI